MCFAFVIEICVCDQWATVGSPIEYSVAIAIVDVLRGRGVAARIGSRPFREAAENIQTVDGDSVALDPVQFLNPACPLPFPEQQFPAAPVHGACELDVLAIVNELCEFLFQGVDWTFAPSHGAFAQHQGRALIDAFARLLRAIHGRDRADRSRWEFQMWHRN